MDTDGSVVVGFDRSLNGKWIKVGLYIQEARMMDKAKMALLFMAVVMVNIISFLCMVVLALMHPLDFIREERKHRSGALR